MYKKSLSRNTDNLQIGDKLRLCLVVTTPNNKNGLGLITLQMAEIAVTLGYQVDIVTGIGQASNSVNKKISPGIQYLPLACLTKYIDPFQDLKAIFSLYQLFRRNKYHVVHTQMAKAGILGRLAAGLARVPIIVHTVHGPTFSPTLTYFRRHLFSFFEKLAGHFTNHFIFVARNLQKAFEEKMIGKKAKKRIIYQGINLVPFLQATQLPKEDIDSLRYTWGLQPEDLVVGYVARMVPSKGHEFAVRACHALIGRYPNLKLVLVGDAMWPEEKSYLQKLESLVLQLGMTDKVIFTGFQNQVAPYYRMFDIFIFPSLYESVGLVLLEAFLSGLPIVAFALPSTLEIGLGEETILTPCYDLSALTAGLAQALENLPNYNKESNRRQAKKAEILEKWSFERWSREIQAFYLELAQQ